MTSVKKASGIILLCILRSTLCIPFSQFYSEQVSLERTILPRGNEFFSNQIRFYDMYTNPFEEHKAPFFYGNEETCLRVSCLFVVYLT